MVEQRHREEFNTVLRMMVGDFNKDPDYIKGPDGKMQGSRPGKGAGGKAKRLRGKVAHDLFTDHPKLPIGTKNYMYSHGNYFYVVDVVGWGEYDCKMKIPIAGNEDAIKRMRQRHGKE